MRDDVEAETLLGHARQDERGRDDLVGGARNNRTVDPDFFELEILPIELQFACLRGSRIGPHFQPRLHARVGRVEGNVEGYGVDQKARRLVVLQPDGAGRFVLHGIGVQNTGRVFRYSASASNEVPNASGKTCPGKGRVTGFPKRNTTL